MALRSVEMTDSRRILRQLGVAADAIELIAAGEGGTTEGIDALAKWCKEQQVDRVILITAVDHGRRVKRALGRAFDERGPEVIVRGVAIGSRNSSNWWRSRRELRSGLIELQKLILDYAMHPIPGW